MPDQPLNGPAQREVFLSVVFPSDLPLCRLWCAHFFPARERGRPSFLERAAGVPSEHRFRAPTHGSEMVKVSPEPVEGRARPPGAPPHDRPARRRVSQNPRRDELRESQTSEILRKIRGSCHSPLRQGRVSRQSRHSDPTRFVVSRPDSRIVEFAQEPPPPRSAGLRSGRLPCIQLRRSLSNPSVAEPQPKRSADILVRQNSSRSADILVGLGRVLFPKRTRMSALQKS